MFEITNAVGMLLFSRHPADVVDIQHGGLSMIDLPAGLGDINGSLVFNQNRLEVEHLTARTGGGLVTFGGFITLAGPAVST